MNDPLSEQKQFYSFVFGVVAGALLGVGVTYYVVTMTGWLR